MVISGTLWFALAFHDFLIQTRLPARPGYVGADAMDERHLRAVLLVPPNRVVSLRRLIQPDLGAATWGSVFSSERPPEGPFKAEGFSVLLDEMQHWNRQSKELRDIQDQLEVADPILLRTSEIFGLAEIGIGGCEAVLNDYYLGEQASGRAAGPRIPRSELLRGTMFNIRFKY